jgi:hypothetical protein
MVEVNGVSPNGRTPRMLYVRREPDGATFWIHPPGSDDGGWQITISGEDERTILEELTRPELHRDV